MNDPHIKYLCALLAAGISFFVGCALASDVALEKTWADSFTNSRTEGKLLSLGTPPFAALMIEDISGKPTGGIILLHDAGQHPDWPYLTRSLRLNLPEQGWYSLSIQLPVQDNRLPMENYAKMLDEATPRIEAAIAALKEKKVKPIFIIGHGLGATMGAMYLATHPKGTSGFVGVGMLDLPGMDGKLDTATYLQKISLPVLDIYGSMDQDHIVQGAKSRTFAARKGAQGKSESSSDKEQITYRQMEIQGADHDFSGLEDILAKRIHGWLLQQISLMKKGKK